MVFLELSHTNYGHPDANFNLPPEVLSVASLHDTGPQGSNPLLALAPRLIAIFYLCFLLQPPLTPLPSHIHVVWITLLRSLALISCRQTWTRLSLTFKSPCGWGGHNIINIRQSRMSRMAMTLTRMEETLKRHQAFQRRSKRCGSSYKPRSERWLSTRQSVCGMSWWRHSSGRE